LRSECKDADKRDEEDDEKYREISPTKITAATNFRHSLNNREKTLPK